MSERMGLWLVKGQSHLLYARQDAHRSPSCLCSSFFEQKSSTYRERGAGSPRNHFSRDSLTHVHTLRAPETTGIARCCKFCTCGAGCSPGRSCRKAQSSTESTCTSKDKETITRHVIDYATQPRLIDQDITLWNLGNWHCGQISPWNNYIT